MVRTALAFCGIGCAVAYAYRGQWTSATLAGAGVILAVAFWAYGEMAATRATMRQPVPEPEPVPRPVVPRPVKPCRPPWLTAPMPAVPAEPEPDFERPVARWQQEALVRCPEFIPPRTARKR